MNLPVEILAEVVRLSSRETQITLCKTSHIFRSLAVRSLYAVVVLDTPRSLLHFCFALQSNPSAGPFVKHLAISYSSKSSIHNLYLSSFYNATRDTLHKLVNLEVLKLFVPDTCTARIFHSANSVPIVFPSLRHFETHLPPDSSLIAFLNRQINLTCLRVSQYEDFRHENQRVADLKGLALPMLQHFSGNSVYLASFAATLTSLRSAYVFWNAVHEVEGPITSLSRTSSHSLNHLVCRRSGWNVDLFGQIAVYLPDIYVLQVINVLVVDALPPQEMLDSICHYLTFFKRLQQLRLRRETQWHSENVQHGNLDHDFQTATTWGTACPSLSVIGFPHSENIEWHRIADNVWIPFDSSPRDRHARNWFRNAVVAGTYPRTPTFLHRIDAYLSKRFPQ